MPINPSVHFKRIFIDDQIPATFFLNIETLLGANLQDFLEGDFERGRV